MSPQHYLSLVETLQPLTNRAAILAVLPGLLEPWGVMVYDPSASQGTVVCEGPDSVARLFGDDETQTQALAGLLSHLLTTSAKHRAAQLCHDLTRLLSVEAQPLESALRLLLETLQAPAGAIVQQRGSHFEPLAIVGSMSEHSPEGSVHTLPLPMTLVETEKAWEVAKTNQAQYGTPLTLCPVGDTAPARTLLLLYRETAWTQADQNLLETASTLLHAWQQSQRNSRHLETLLELERTGLETTPEALLQAVLEAAVKTVPGAEAGSLLVKQGKSFQFFAAFGFDLSALREVSFKASDMQAWYTQGGSAWNWEARIVEVTPPFLEEIYAKVAVPEALERAGRLNDIKANLSLPIVYQGELLAVLNLHNFYDKDGFAQDSLAAAHLFGSPVAVVLRERYYRYLLEQAALTDALTGVGNRRAFEHALKQEVSRSARHQQGFCLLVLDLANFKIINDSLGHSQGDTALIQVAKTLHHVKRRSDVVFRLGGDEFAVLLPHTHYEGGLVAARRYARAIKRIELLGYRLGVNIGVASFPACASSEKALLELADQRMYSAKSAGHSVYDDPSVKLSSDEGLSEESGSVKDTGVDDAICFA